MASLIVLDVSWSSLPMMQKLLVVGLCSVCWMYAFMGGRLLEMFLVPLPQCPCCFPYVFITAGNVPTLIAVYYPTLLVLGVLALRLHEELFDCSVSLEVSLYSMHNTYLLKAFWYSFSVGDDHKCYTRILPCWGASLLLAPGLWVSCVALLSLLLLACSMLALVWQLLSCRLLLFLLSPRLLLMYLLWTLLMAQWGYLHLNSASLWCSNSFWKSCGLEQTVLALWVSVPMMLYLADRLWWLSHCGYWSVWVGLWYAVMDRELSAWGVTKVSRNGTPHFLDYLLL